MSSTAWIIDIFDPKTEDLVLTVQLSPEEAEAVRRIIPEGPGEHRLTEVFVGETQR